MHQASLMGRQRKDPPAPARVMGVINVSPESFYKKSVQTDPKSIRERARTMAEEGADMIDVGAMSTAPYLRTQISEETEISRIRTAVRTIRGAVRVPLSVDTTRSAVARAGLDAGANIINDVSGLAADPEMGAVVKRAKGVILMANPKYYPMNTSARAIFVAKALLKKSMALAIQRGVDKRKIIIDPGIGFFRNRPQPWWKCDLNLIARLKVLRDLKAPVLVGISRKSFISEVLSGKSPEERLPGSIAATICAVLNGASIIRTHDVAATKEALEMVEQLNGG